MTVARADVDGDGRPDLILFYGHLSTRRVAGGFNPIGFTLKIVRASGGVLTRPVALGLHVENPTIVRIRDVNDRPGVEILIQEASISSGSTFGVYTFNGHELQRAGGLEDGGDSATRYGFTCQRGHPATIVQHQFLLEGPSMTGRWQSSDTTYVWVGSRLRRAAMRTTDRTGIPPANLTSPSC